MIDLHVIAIGAFGEAVAADLAARIETVVTTGPGIDEPSFWPASRLQIVAAWREAPRVFDLAERIAFHCGRPWLPIAIDATSMRVGPLVDGVSGPCHLCFRTRQRQHRRHGPADDELYAAYDADPSVGVFGHLPAHVSLAVAAARLAVYAVLTGADGSPEFGRVRRFGLLSPQVLVDDVTAVHGCPRCHRPEPDASWSRLAQDLAELPTSTPSTVS